jgi:hypothetical protein
VDIIFNTLHSLSLSRRSVIGLKFSDSGGENLIKTLAHTDSKRAAGRKTINFLSPPPLKLIGADRARTTFYIIF